MPVGKIGSLKSMIKFLKNTCEGVFISKVTGNSPKILLKMNYLTNKDFRPQTSLGYFTKQLHLKTCFFRSSVQPGLTCSNSIELTSTIYKVNNKDTRTTSFDVFLVSFIIAAIKIFL